jgi:hypothetical protein
MKIIAITEYFTPELCAKQSRCLFVFGDNIARRGKYGQACIRDNINSYGIPTKRLPSISAVAYFSDDQFEDNKLAIQTAMSGLLSYARSNFHTIAFPKAGLGTGLARLKEKAPQTWEFLCAELIERFGFDNEKGEIVK